MLEKIEGREKPLALLASLMFLSTILLGFGYVNSSTEVQELNERVDELSEQKNELEESKNNLKSENNNLQNNINSLEEELEIARDYRLYNPSESVRENYSPEDWIELTNTFDQWNKSQKVGVNLAGYADRFSEDGTYPEAAATYYIASDYMQEAKNHMIDFRSVLDDDEKRDDLRTAVEGYQKLETFYEKLGDLNYARARGDQEEISQLETEVNNLQEEIQDLTLDIKLMENIFESSE